MKLTRSEICISDGICTIATEREAQDDATIKETSVVGRSMWCSFREIATLKKSWNLKFGALGKSSIDGDSLQLLYKVWLMRLSSYIKTLNKMLHGYNLFEISSPSIPSAYATPRSVVPFQYEPICDPLRGGYLAPLDVFLPLAHP